MKDDFSAWNYCFAAIRLFKKQDNAAPGLGFVPLTTCGDLLACTSASRLCQLDTCLGGRSVLTVEMSAQIHGSISNKM